MRDNGQDTGSSQSRWLARSEIEWWERGEETNVDARIQHESQPGTERAAGPIQPSSGRGRGNGGESDVLDDCALFPAVAIRHRLVLSEVTEQRIKIDGAGRSV